MNRHRQGPCDCMCCEDHGTDVLALRAERDAALAMVTDLVAEYGRRVVADDDGLVPVENEPNSVIRRARTLLGEHPTGPK